MKPFWVLFTILQFYNHYAFCDDQYENSIQDENYERPNEESEKLTIVNPEYWLYTRANSIHQKLQIGNSLDLLSSNFRFNKITWFIIHGWISNGSLSYVQDLKDAYLNRWDVNVMVINWGETASNLYPIARYNVPVMAAKVCEFIKFLIANGYSMDNINLVGHSLGAHLAGLTGKLLGDKVVPSVTGIDPAWPLFYFDDENGRISQNSAKYVEIIHSNAGFFGYLGPIGETDIYINGGTFQPECAGTIGMCNHLAGFVRYIQTIANNREYYAYKCAGFTSAVVGNCSRDVALKVGGSLPKLWIPGVYFTSTITDW